MKWDVAIVMNDGETIVETHASRGEAKERLEEIMHAMDRGTAVVLHGARERILALNGRMIRSAFMIERPKRGKNHD